MMTIPKVFGNTLEERYLTWEKLINFLNNARLHGINSNLSR